MGREIQGYELQKVEDLKDVKSEGLLYRHRKSGARVMVISNDDDNKVFSIGFRTPPTDNTGIPHIIEHSVLCGSRSFPAKDPFVELAKGSLNTFLNAMTFSDKTMYPVASCNDKDFQNLMHIYLDAVFYPNIYNREEIFLQEGWHYELSDPEGEIAYNGVVYNEMKGVFSSPEEQLGRMVQQSLFPDTAYGTESGGDPDYIPDLTYEQFLDYHKTYYHPSNSYIYLYGDMDVEEKLRFLDENYLGQFEYESVDSAIRLQEPFGEMKEVWGEYALAEGEDQEGKTYFNYNVVVDTSLNEDLYWAFQVLHYALASAPGAPLKQALIDAGVGEEVSGSYDGGILQPVFDVVVKNARSDQRDECLRIIKGVLRDVAEKGIDSKSLLAGINVYEFRYREADYGRYPKGLMYGIQIMDSWLYDDEKPFRHILANAKFEALKKKVSSDYYKKLIKEYLLDNPHSSFITLEPKKGLTGRKEAEVRQRLDAYKNSLSGEELEGLVRRTEELRAYQDEPSTKEELETIPLLEREDIGKEAQPIHNEWKKISEVPILFHEESTNGIAYIGLAFDVTSLRDWTPYMGLLAIVLGYIDTEHYSFLELSNEINIHTGGISTSVETYAKRGDTDDYSMKFEINVKVLYGSFSKSFEYIEEILQNSKLDDEKRLREILAETKARLQGVLTSRGHTTAVARGLAYSSDSAYVGDQTKGIGFYRFIERLYGRFEEEKESLVAIFKELMQAIFCKKNMMVDFTADREGYELLERSLDGFSYALHKKASVMSIPPAIPLGAKKALNEGFKTPGKVQYVARTGNFIKGGVPFTGALRVVKTILSYDYLWLGIRVKGGAYGAMCGFSYDGGGYFTSYRDPGLSSTIQIYEGIAEFLETFESDERDMTKYIIGTISGMDTPLSPHAKGKRAYHAQMMGITWGDLQKEREEVLTTTVEDVRGAAKAAKAIMASGDVCVIGSEQKVEEDKGLFGTIEHLS